MPAPALAGAALTQVSGAGLVGAAFGGAAVSKNGVSRADGHCDAQSFCDATGKEARLDAIHAAPASTVGFVAGAMALAGGVILIIVGKPVAPARAALEVGPGNVAIGGTWR